MNGLTEEERASIALAAGFLRGVAEFVPGDRRSMARSLSDQLAKIVGVQIQPAVSRAEAVNNLTGG